MIQELTLDRPLVMIAHPSLTTGQPFKRRPSHARTEKTTMTNERMQETRDLFSSSTHTLILHGRWPHLIPKKLPGVKLTEPFTATDRKPARLCVRPGPLRAYRRVNVLSAGKSVSSQIIYLTLCCRAISVAPAGTLDVPIIIRVTQVTVQSACSLTGHFFF